MIVKNKTRYRTPELRRLFQYAMLKCGIERSPRHIWLVKYAKPSKRVVTEYAKTFRIAGQALLGRIYADGKFRVGNIVWMFMSPHGESNGIYVAQVAIHELMHNLGLGHKDIEECIHMDVSDLPEDLKLLKERPHKKEAG